MRAAYQQLVAQHPGQHHPPPRLAAHAATATISPVVSCGMNTAAKLLAAMRRNPLDWKIGDLQTVGRQSGLDWRHEKSSHCVFIRKDGRTPSVPAHRPIKAVYIRKFIELVDGV